jgi:hypothetical protein
VIPSAPDVRVARRVVPPMECPRCGGHGWETHCNRCLIVLDERIPTYQTKNAAVRSPRAVGGGGGPLLGDAGPAAKPTQAVPTGGERACYPDSPRPSSGARR